MPPLQSVDTPQLRHVPVTELSELTSSQSSSPVLTVAPSPRCQQASHQAVSRVAGEGHVSRDPTMLATRRPASGHPQDARS